MPQDIEGLLLCPIIPSVLFTNLARAIMMWMPFLASGGLRLWKLASQAVHVVCEEVQVPHGKVETLYHGAQLVEALRQGNASPGMTPLGWSQAQAKDPAIHQIVEGIQNRTLGKLKIKGGMPPEMKALIRVKKQLFLKQGVLYRTDIEPSFRTNAIEGCHDQVGHLGQDRVLELLKDQFYWSGMHTDVASYINSSQVFEKKVPARPSSST